MNLSYQVNLDGTVVSHKRGKTRLLKGSPDKDGYIILHLVTDEGEHTYIKEHRLVALTHVPNPLGLPFVNHKNGIKTDNRAENLEWVTNEQNMAHASATGLMRRGSSHPQSKLTKHEVRTIKASTDSYSVLATRYGVSVSAIGFIKSGKNWGWL